MKRHSNPNSAAPLADNCYERHVLNVWRALSTGAKSKVKAEAREAFYSMLLCAPRGQRNGGPLVSIKVLDYIRDQYTLNRETK